ncbi:MAG: hypothetical protein E7Z88_01000 [Cyanobacteria bacterium SIG27]|nr:hypothetical protein [Cyanobacteria bacterium SIG27]
MKQKEKKTRLGLMLASSDALSSSTLLSATRYAQTCLSQLLSLSAHIYHYKKTMFSNNPET